MRSGLKGALLALEVLPAPVRPLGLLTPGPERSELQTEDVALDRYEPWGPGGSAPIVVVHGANPGGKDDPRVVAFADALARTGRTVLVPQLALRDRRLDPDDRGRILAAVRLATESGATGVLAFSYGGGLALAALAEDPDLQEDVTFVATVGTYYDVLHIVQGVTTGTVPVDGEIESWEPASEAPEILAEQLAALLPRSEGRALEDAWEARDPEGLDTDARAVYELLVNDDPERFDELVRRLPERIRRVARELSPSRVVDRVRVPVYALHSRTDPASPPSESRLLVRALEGRVPTRLAVVGVFEHVTPVGSFLGQLGDAYRVARFAGTLLGAQEGWPRP